MIHCILESTFFENDSNAETRLFATSLISAIQTKKFVILFVFFARFYGYSKFETRSKQSKLLEILSSANLIDKLKDLLNNLDYDETLKKCIELAKRHVINSFDTRSSSRQHHLPDS